MKRLPPPTQWSEEWYYAVDEDYATSVAKELKAKTFNTFCRQLVNTFGACDDMCAAYLWNKIHPDKPRKYLEVFDDN